jgi:uncharacterized protein (DUF2147 family)
MTNRFLVCALSTLFLFGVSVFAEEEKREGADALLGVWLTAEGKAKVEITKKKDVYSGKFIWLKEPVYPKGDPEEGVAKHDRYNPDKTKRDTPAMGMTLVHDFKYDTKSKTWKDGRVYDPEVGKMYKAYLRLEGDTLKLRGYIGIPAIGRTEVWTRVYPEKEKKKEADAKTVKAAELGT